MEFCCDSARPGDEAAKSSLPPACQENTLRMQDKKTSLLADPLVPASPTHQTEGVALAPHVHSRGGLGFFQDEREWEM